MFKALYYDHVIGSSAQQFTNAVVVAKCRKQGIINGRIFTPIEKKKALEGRRRMLITLRVDIETRKTIFKTITLHHLHPRFLTSTLILHFLPRNQKPKVTNSTTKQKTYQRKITKEYKTSYLCYYYP